MKRSKIGVLPVWIILFIAIAAAGCYENDPMAQPVNADNEVTAGEVAGIYEFTRFEFVPNDESVAPVNMLDTLISLTELKLGTDDRFMLSYRFDGGAQRSIGGAMKVNTRNVQLDAESGNEKALEALLLGDSITLDREDMQLRASISSMTDSTRMDSPMIDSPMIGSPMIDSTMLFAPHEGLSSTEGTLEIRLRPRAAH